MDQNDLHSGITPDEEEHEDDAAEGAASLIGMRIRRRSRRGQGFPNQTRSQQPSSQAPSPARPQRLQEPAVPQQPASPPPSVAPTLQAESGSPKLPQEIVAYWDRLRNGRKFPSRADLDAMAIAQNWPNSMLIKRNRDNKGWQLETQFSGGFQGGSHGQHMSKGSGAECASMVTEWILSLGREVASLGKPLQDTEVFPTSLGEVRYNVIALPLSDNQNEIDHVLYHLVPATGDK